MFVSLGLEKLFQPRHGSTRRALVGCLWLLTAVGCDCSHSHDHDGAHAPAHDASTHSHSTANAEGEPSSDLFAALSPFQIKSTIVDGAVMSDGDALVLVFGQASSTPTETETEPTDEMVWFLNRTETGSECAMTVRSIAAGQGVRSETMVLTPDALDLDSRHTNTGDGFAVRGDLSWQKPGQFDVNITREVGDKARIHRTMAGVCGPALLTGQSELRTANWDTKTWSVRHRTRNYLMVGIPEPSAAPGDPAGEWRSVTLNGAIRRLDWTLTANRWTLKTVDGGSDPASLGQGDYTVGPKGQLELVSDAANDFDRAGHINTAVGAAVVQMSPPGGSYSSASYLWKQGAGGGTSATPGTWYFSGRQKGEGQDTGLISGTLELASDGGLRGELQRFGEEEVIPFIGKLNPGIPASGNIQFSFSAAPSGTELTSHGAGSSHAPPHSH